MELTFSDKREILLDSLTQIRNAITQLIEWNKDITDMNELLKSPGGTQDLAGNCMVLMAICEGFKKIEKQTNGEFLIQRPEIPWKQIFGLRDRIAHGYFDIDVEIISQIINEDLVPLLNATEALINTLSAQ